MSEMSNSFNSVYRRMGNGQVGDGGNAVEEENSRINLTSEFIQEQEGASGASGHQGQVVPSQSRGLQDDQV